MNNPIPPIFNTRVVRSRSPLWNPMKPCFLAGERGMMFSTLHPLRLPGHSWFKAASAVYLSRVPLQVVKPWASQNLRDGPFLGIHLKELSNEILGILGIVILQLFENIGKNMMMVMMMMMMMMMIMMIMMMMMMMMMWFQTAWNISCNISYDDFSCCWILSVELSIASNDDQPVLL